MRMSDIISSLGLTFFPILGMVLFLIVFVGVVMQVMGRERRSELDRAGSLPLDDDDAPAASTHAAHTATEPRP